MYRFYFNCHHWKPTYDQWIYANRCLPTDELQRIDQYVFQRDVKFALIGQLLIRYLLTRVFHHDSSSFHLHRTNANRPFIHSEPPFDFNLSHRYQLVCIAGTFDGRIGCDTMDYRKQSLGKSILRKKFTAKENQLIEENPLNFVRLWALKESYVKWLGMGVGFPFFRLNFHLSTTTFSSPSSSSSLRQIISDSKLEIDDDDDDVHQLVTSVPIRFDEQLIDLSSTEQQLITLCLPERSPCQSFLPLDIDDLLHGCTPLNRNKTTPTSPLITWERFQMKDK